MKTLCTIHFHYGTFAKQKFYLHNNHIRVKSLDAPHIKFLEWLQEYDTFEAAILAIANRYNQTNCSIEWSKTAQKIIV